MHSLDSYTKKVSFLIFTKTFWLQMFIAAQIIVSTTHWVAPQKKNEHQPTNQTNKQSCIDTIKRMANIYLSIRR